MSVSWPALPDVQTNFQHGIGQVPVRRLQMASGRTRQYKRHTAAVEVYNVQWVFADALDFATFQNFFRTSINNGADFFTIDLPIGTMGQNLASAQARFVNGVYKAQYFPGGGYWTVTAQLEVHSPVIMSEATYNFYESQSDIIAVAIVEAANAQDTSSLLNLKTVAIVESTSATDSCSVKVVFAPSITEAATAADTPTCKQTAVASITEAASANDTVTEGTKTSAAITEAATAADTVRAILSASCTEAASATDSSICGLLKTSAVSEGGSPFVDQAGNTLVTDDGSTGIQSDGGVATDTCNATVIRAVAIIENVDAIDTSSGATNNQLVDSSGNALIDSSSNFLITS